MYLWFRFATILVLLTASLGLIALLASDGFITPLKKLQQIHSVSDWYKHLYSTESVAMEFFGTTYYGFDKEGVRNYEHLMPRGGSGAHLVRLDDDGSGEERVYTVTLFHQLKCLEICHRALVEGTPLDDLPPVVGHCLNYLRQQVLCRVDSTLESGVTNVADTAKYYSSTCRDWTKVYEAAEILVDQ